MPKWLRFTTGCVLWMFWGMITSSMGLKAFGERAGDFWMLWFITLGMVLWYGLEHHFEKKDD